MASQITGEIITAAEALSRINLDLDTTSTTIALSASQYSSEDNCLGAAAHDIATARGLEGWDLSARWEDNERKYILVDVPRWSVGPDDEI